MIDPQFVYLAAAITFVGILIYAIDTFKGKTRPNRVTWILWTIVPFITFFAQLNEHVGLSAVYALSYAIGPLCVVIASFANKKAYWQLTIFDYLCGGISLLAIILWAITGDGMVAIIFSILADFAAGLPTLRKAFFDPESENISAYLAGVFSATITLLTIQSWTVATYLFPLYILVDSALLCLTIKVFSKLNSKG